MSAGAGPVLMFGGHRVQSLDDISRFADSQLFLLSSSNNFQSLKDGRAEANFAQQGLKVTTTKQ